MSQIRWHESVADQLALGKRLERLERLERWSAKRLSWAVVGEPVSEPVRHVVLGDAGRGPTLPTRRRVAPPVTRPSNVRERGSAWGRRVAPRDCSLARRTGAS